MSNVRMSLIAVIFSLSMHLTAVAEEALVFVSSMAPGDKGAVQAFHLNLQTGALTAAERTGGVSNPFFLALSPDRKTLYSNDSAQFGGKVDEYVAAFHIERSTGSLKPLGRQSSRGTVSCYVDATASALVVANYGSGSVASLPVHEDGSLGEPVSFFKHVGSSVDKKRQSESHAHSIVVSPDGRFALSADLGLDQVLVYRLDGKTAALSPNEPPHAKAPAGAGPRHLTFHSDGRHVYVINEMANSITTFDYDAERGSLSEKTTISTLPADFTGKSYCADVKTTTDGKFLFGTNRGHDSIAAYRLGEDGLPTLVGIYPSLGKGPQNLAIAPGGEFLLCANMPGSNIVVFRIDRKTGALQAVGEPTPLPQPSCIMIVP